MLGVPLVDRRLWHRQQLAEERIELLKFLRRTAHVVSMIAPMLFVASVAYSQTPSPTPAKTSQEPQRGTAGVQQTTQNPQPVAVPLSPTSSQITSAQPQVVVQQTNGEKNGDSASNWWLVVFTGGLLAAAIIQAWVFYQQSGIMQGQLSVAKDVAAASKSSAEAAAKSVEILNEPYLTCRNWVLAKKLPSGRIDYQVINVGRTTATNVVTHIKVKGMPPNDLPEIPDYTGADVGPPAVITPGPPILRMVMFEADMTEHHAKLIMEGQTVLYVFGYMTYETQWGERRERFGVYFDPKTLLFPMIPSPLYNGRENIQKG